MIFTFENLGSIKQAELELGKLTVICGKNNTGKTYLSYAVWGVLERVIEGLWNNELNTPIFPDTALYKLTQEKEVDMVIAGKTMRGKKLVIDLKDYKAEIIKKTNIWLASIMESLHLSSLFGTDESLFEDTKVNFKITDIEFNIGGTLPFINENGELIGDMIEAEPLSTKYELRLTNNFNQNNFSSFRSLIKPLYFLQYFFSAQRESINLFRGAINQRNDTLWRVFRTNEITDINNLDSYARPLENNIYFTNSHNLELQKSLLWKKQDFAEIEEMLGVQYVLGNNGFSVRTQNGQIVPMSLVSTSVRNLADLHFYLKHAARKNDLIMIDEPELNLHPENQIKIARLLVKLVNKGLRVWITTHSDYIVKELNNCLMLSNDFSDKPALLQKLGYKESDILQKSDICYYTAMYDEKISGNTLVRSKVGKYGISAPSFDETLEQIVNTSNQIIDALDE